MPLTIVVCIIQNVRIVGVLLRSESRSKLKLKKNDERGSKRPKRINSTLTAIRKCIDSIFSMRNIDLISRQ